MPKEKRVNQLDPETNKVIKTWNSVKEAGEGLGVEPKRISGATKNPLRKVKGFRWKIAPEPKVADGIKQGKLGRYKWGTSERYSALNEILHNTKKYFYNLEIVPNTESSKSMVNKIMKDNPNMTLRDFLHSIVEWERVELLDKIKAHKRRIPG